MCWDRVIDVETPADARAAAPRSVKRPADAEPATPVAETARPGVRHGRAGAAAAS